MAVTDSKPQAIEALEALASSHVADGQRPNLYVVTDRGVVVTVTRNLKLAKQHFEELAARRPLQECALEDRAYGTLACVEPASDDPGSPLTAHWW